MVAPNVISRDGFDISGVTANAPKNAVPGIFFYDTTQDIAKVVNNAGVAVPVTGGLGAPGASTAATGTNAATAATLPAATAAVYPVTGATGSNGVIINAADNVTGRNIGILNAVSNQSLNIYPPTGGTINGAAANAALVTTSGRGASLYCASPGTWYTV